MKLLTASKVPIAVGATFILCVALVSLLSKKTIATAPTQAKPALSVTTFKPKITEWPKIVPANGNVVAWQEASIGTELTGLQLSEVLVDVGDQVKKGQVLARFVSDSINANLAEQQASVEIAEAAFAEASTDAERIRRLGNKNALSEQQINQYLTAERSAKARLNAARAKLNSEIIRKRQTDIVAPDDGTISARSAVLGGIGQPGQELFKLIRKNKLEWRAEVTAEDLALIAPQQTVALKLSNDQVISGVVRSLSPTLNPATRTALVYVNLPHDPRLRAGMYLGGNIILGRSPSLTLPPTAISTRDGLAYVFVIRSGNTVTQTQVKLGRRHENHVEVVEGIDQHTELVLDGTGFLSDGDKVLIVDTPT